MSKNSREIEVVDHIEHVKITNMYSGSKATGSQLMYILDNDTNKFVKTEIQFNQTLYKMIDEVIVNAIDHWSIYPNEVSYIKIYFDIDTGKIKVENNGPTMGIKLTKNSKGQQVYSVEVAATDFMASSNFRSKKRTTGGINGIGLKLTNVYSRWLSIYTSDTTKKQSYEQKYEDGIKKINPPIIKNTKDKEDRTWIEFLPNYEELNYPFDKKHANYLYKLIEARTYQAAAYTSVKVFLNDNRIDLGKKDKFLEFSKMFINSESIHRSMLVGGEFPLDICIAASDTDKFEQISIINGINTYDGGSFIDHVQNVLVEALRTNVEKILKQTKSNKKFTKSMLINHLFIFIKGKVANPEFDAQIKNKLSNKIETFSPYKFNATSDIKKIWSIISSKIEIMYLNKQIIQEKKNVVRGEVHVPKCEDAQFAGSVKHSADCILWIAEGDSAEGYIRKGILSKKSSLELKYCGIFKIGGVPMNCRPKCNKKVHPQTKEIVILRNKEVNNCERLNSLIKVLGLDYGKKYDYTTEKGMAEIATLRYGKIFVGVDQDVDGNNIFGIILSNLEYFWPNLIKYGYICKFNTPIIRAFPKNGNKIDYQSKELKEFYSESDFQEWLATNKAHKYSIKYYKGLGTHEDDTIPEIFKNYKENIFKVVSDNSSEEKLDIYYGGNSDLRKKVLKEPHTELKKSSSVPISKICDSLVKEYFMHKNARNIPHAIDGLTESRRKVLWGAYQWGGISPDESKQIKVAALSAYVTTLTLYAHGEQVLANTIILMAQTFKGSNNLPLLKPKGSFGTRSAGGNDAASPRYIYTRLNHELYPKLFPPSDDYVLKYRIIEGTRCEPEYYVPILPLVLLENYQGNIGVGWSSTLWARNLDSVIRNVKSLINGKIQKSTKMKFWLKDNKGRIVYENNKEYSVGTYEYDDKKNTIRITELPVGMYPKSYLEIDSKTDKPFWKRSEFSKKPFNNTDQDIDITLYLNDGVVDDIKKKYKSSLYDPIEQFLGLKKCLSANLNVLDENDCIKEFSSYEDILDNWFYVRKELYKKRLEREKILVKLEILYHQNILRFIDEEAKYKFNSKTELQEMKDRLAKENYTKFNEECLRSPKYTPINELEEAILKTGASYHYLLSLNNIDKSAGNSRRRKSKLEEKLKYQQQIDASIKDSRFPGADIWMHEIEELEEVLKAGFATNWK